MANYFKLTYKLYQIDLKAERKKLREDKSDVAKEVDKYKKENQVLTERILEVEKDRKNAELKKKESNRETSDYFKENKRLSDEKRDMEEKVCKVDDVYTI